MAWQLKFRALLQEKIKGPSDAGKGKSKMSKNITHGFHLVKGKSNHAMEDFMYAQFRQLGDDELGLFAIFDGHLSSVIPDYLRNHLFENILNEVLRVPSLASVIDLGLIESLIY